MCPGKERFGPQCLCLIVPQPYAAHYKTKVSPRSPTALSDTENISFIYNRECSQLNFCKLCVLTNKLLRAAVTAVLFIYRATGGREGANNLFWAAGNSANITFILNDLFGAVRTQIYTYLDPCLGREPRTLILKHHT